VIPRSYLYVPGDQQDKLAKARRRGADAYILDLEDAVAPAAKPAGRSTVAAFLDGTERLTGSPGPAAQWWLRINPGDTGLTDIATAWRPVLTGVMVAKVESAADLEPVDGALADAETAAGIPVGRTSVVPLLESAAAVLAATAIAAGPRVTRLQIGEADLASELGLDRDSGGTEVLRTVRSMVVLASSAAGIEPPVAPISTDFRDLEALRASTRMLAGMGFVGRTCIHPAQVPIVNEVFTPDPDAVAAAASLVSRFDATVAEGRGVMVADDGSMVDEAVVRQARRLLALAGVNGSA
jgi:citrate lyase subunit beta/citryl-CoA lyase